MFGNVSPQAIAAMREHPVPSLADVEAMAAITAATLRPRHARDAARAAFLRDVKHGWRDLSDKETEIPKAKPRDFADHSELYQKSGILVMADNANDEQFEEALAEAKSEGNVSRANVVRKIRNKKDRPAEQEPANPDGPLKLTGQKRLDRIAELAARFGTTTGTEPAKPEPTKAKPTKPKPLTEAQKRTAAQAVEDAEYRRYWPA